MPGIVCVRPIRLLDTTAFRLTLIYLGLFGVSSLALLGYLYFATAGIMTRQTTETIQAEIDGLREQYRVQGLPRLRQVIEQRSAVQPHRASIYLLNDPAGGWVAGNIDRWPDVMPGENGWLTFPVKVRPDGLNTESRRAVALEFHLRGGYRLLVGREVEERLQLQTRIKHALSWGLGLTLLLGLVGGLVMSRGLLRRVDGINRTTRQIMKGDLSQRISMNAVRGDEFDQLAANLNAMLEQIERLLNGMRQVTDNIAHDLRTPLNRMRSRIEVALISDHESDMLKPVLEETLQDAEAMIATFNALLDIARAEAGSDRSAFEEVDLGDIVENVTDLYQPLAEDKGQTIDLAVLPDQPLVANRHLLSQALANLLDNAVKYTPEGGRITISLTSGPMIKVADSGPGIPAESHDDVLERFVRLDQTRSTPGNGLGLSLVNAVAKLHGATLTLEDNAPGLIVVLTFVPAEEADRSKARNPPPEIGPPALPENA